MNEHEDLIRRLGTLGREPVEPGVATEHLAAMTAAPARRTRQHHLRTVAAFVVGLLAGTTGLATAGALPDSAQEVAHDTLGAVGVNVPHGDRYQGPGCGDDPQKVWKNHGEYVRSQPKEKRAEAAKSRCGKPLGAGKDDEGPSTGGGDCQGKPPWAGNKMDKAAKEAAQAERRARCGDKDAEDESDEPKAKGSEAPEGKGHQGVAPETESSTTTTTVGETTTTTIAEETTTTSTTTTTGEHESDPNEDENTTTTTAGSSGS